MPALLKMLSDPDSDISAAAALGAWGSPQALPGLLEAFKRGSKDLRLEILEAFSRIPDPRVGPLLDQIARMVNEPLVHDKATPSDRASSRACRFSGDCPPHGRSRPSISTRRPARLCASSFATRAPSDASDLHIAAGTRPHLRRTGRLEPLPLPETDVGQMWEWMPGDPGRSRRGARTGPTDRLLLQGPRARPLPYERLPPAQGAECRLPPGPLRDSDALGRGAAREPLGDHVPFSGAHPGDRARRAAARRPRSPPWSTGSTRRSARTS